MSAENISTVWPNAMISQDLVDSAIHKFSQLTRGHSCSTWTYWASPEL